LVDYSFDRDDFFDRDPRGLFDQERARDLQRDFDQERRDRERADELERRGASRAEQRRAGEAKQDANDDDMSRIRRTLSEMPMEEMVELINNPRVMITPRGITSSRRTSGRDTIRSSGQFSRANLLPPLKKPRKKNKKHCKNLSMCLRQANAELRTKSGKLRKGKTQADIMRRAQRLLKKC
jgi:hypothetical protein